MAKEPVVISLNIVNFISLILTTWGMPQFRYLHQGRWAAARGGLKIHTVFSGFPEPDSEEIKPFTTRLSGCRAKVWNQIWYSAYLLTVTSKAVSEGNRRFWLQNLLPRFSGRAQVLRVGRASTNTGRSRVGSSRCGPQPARFIKKCYPFCWLSSRAKKVLIDDCKNPAKQQIQIDDLCKKRESAQIPIEEHSHFKCWHNKAWRRSLAWISIDCNHSLQPNWTQNKSDVRKSWRDLHWLCELRLLMSKLLLKIIIHCISDTMVQLGLESVLNFKFLLLAFLKSKTW